MGDGGKGNDTFVHNRKENDLENENYCELCGAEIWEDEERYEMPDGRIVCCLPDCLNAWAEDYLFAGGRW